jgi:hypothetical protein
MVQLNIQLFYVRGAVKVPQTLHTAFGRFPPAAVGYTNTATATSTTTDSPTGI